MNPSISTNQATASFGGTALITTTEWGATRCQRESGKRRRRRRICPRAWRDIGGRSGSRPRLSPCRWPHRAGGHRKLEFEPYALIRRQLLNLLRAANRVRKKAGYTPLPPSVIRMRRRIVKPFEGAEEPPLPLALPPAEAETISRSADA
jgi:hypothetical protein